MSADRDVWADVVLAVVAQLRRLWEVVPAADWSRPAAHVGWSCWQTAEHIAGDFAHYAGQVLACPPDHYVAFGFDTGRARTAAELVEVVAVAGGMLAAAVRTADPAAVGWHPHGLFDPAGFAAIGAAEGLVHGIDMATGLAVQWAPRRRTRRTGPSQGVPRFAAAGRAVPGRQPARTHRTRTPRDAALDLRRRGGTTDEH
jgi:hypothetical protein